MQTTQRTIKNSISLSGIGLHSGEHSTITFKPAAEHEGIRFQRIDLPGQPVIPALIDYVIDISRGTTLGINDAKIMTVEHLLAAVTGLEIDNVLIEVDNVEVPVLDGSAEPYVNALLEAGIQEQKAERKFFEFDQPISFSVPEKNVDVVLVPSNDLKVTFLIDFPHPVIGTQYTFLESLESEFITEFSKARTFCFLQEIEYLREHNLIKGGRLDNAVVLGDPNTPGKEMNYLRELFNLPEDDNVFMSEKGILNGVELRYYNEMVRHKVVDLIGDLALLGVPVKGHVLCARSGHESNVGLVKKLKKIYEKQLLEQQYQKQKTEGLVFDVCAIEKILPHRYPFLLVDRIIEFNSKESIVGLKNVTYNEPFFQGHFPQHPIMPGVLIVEAMGQTGGVLLLNLIPEEERGNKLVYFMGFDKVKFRAPVVPGDQLRFELKLDRFKRGVAKMTGQAFVAGKMVCQAEMMAKIMDK